MVRREPPPAPRSSGGKGRGGSDSVYSASPGGSKPLQGAAGVSGACADSGRCELPGRVRGRGAWAGRLSGTHPPLRGPGAGRSTRRGGEGRGSGGFFFSSHPTPPPRRRSVRKRKGHKRLGRWAGPTPPPDPQIRFAHPVSLSIWAAKGLAALTHPLGGVACQGPLSPGIMAGNSGPAAQAPLEQGLVTKKLPAKVGRQLWQATRPGPRGGRGLAKIQSDTRSGRGTDPWPP
jgi:hypothetical protein